MLGSTLPSLRAIGGSQDPIAFSGKHGLDEGDIHRHIIDDENGEHCLYASLSFLPHLALYHSFERRRQTLKGDGELGVARPGGVNILAFGGFCSTPFPRGKWNRRREQFCPVSLR